MSILPIYKKLPMDIVNKILLYDRRYVIHNGKIILIRKLDLDKYSVIINLLLKKPKIIELKIWSSIGEFWKSYIVYFSINHKNHFNYSIQYSINYTVHNTVLYEFFVTKGDSTACSARLYIK